MDDKATLLRYLRTARTDLLGKIDGLSEYDARRPLTPTGTNLLGLVKHVASVQLGYFTDTFGRPTGITAPWLADDAPDDSDMWVPADESTASIVAFHEASAQASDEVIEALDLDAPGTVPWWPDERSAVTLHQILVHVLAETARHAGHADILREHVDGLAGQRVGDANVPARSSDQWSAYAARIEAAARAVAESAPS
ncbi:DinB family protein [Cellulomonas rhizosphaerae]|uniref:DinB family protein n=1 Tax=Cellulomonas rhizosphaerae TaxID=2293719 RepID=A0A413RQA0_9CELL|nr:DinB family protein [Cellulomonas rhizosphaerae]RHA44114.1 DinB family protein [Cellulomonas rhizosphaerae]